MENSQFWNLIDSARAAAGGDPDEQVEELAELLNDLDADELVEFERIREEYHRRAYHWDLWGAAYLINGGCSDDGFDYFRAWLITRGELVFENGLRDPDSLADVIEETDIAVGCESEDLLYVAVRVWETLTGEPGEAFPLPVHASHGGPAGESWEEDELDTRFPKLAARFA